MRVSVIVITRNHSGCLADVLAALAKQDHPDFEVIIVDSSAGEEKEKSVKLAEQFRAKYVFEPRLGQSLARNSGLPLHRRNHRLHRRRLPAGKKLALVLVQNFSSPEIWGCSGRVIPHRSETAADIFEEVAGQDLGGNRRVLKPGEVRFSVGLILQNVGKVFAKHMKGKGLAPWCVGHGSSMSSANPHSTSLAGSTTASARALRSRAARTLTSTIASCDPATASSMNRVPSSVTTTIA